MGFSKKFINELLYGLGRRPRFTQDSPIRPDTWIAFGENPAARVPLLLEPHARSTPAELYRALRDAIDDPAVLGPMRLTYNQSVVIGDFTVTELLLHILPWTPWYGEWRCLVRKTVTEHKQGKISAQEVAQGLDGSRMEDKAGAFLFLYGLLLCSKQEASDLEQEVSSLSHSRRYERLVQFSTDRQLNFNEEILQKKGLPRHRGTLLWAVNHNRDADLAVAQSALTVKADAAIRLFEIDCSKITWAVVDSGIDASHPAFALRAPPASSARKGADRAGEGRMPLNSRIIATYDFTRIRDLLSDPDQARRFLGGHGDGGESAVETLQRLKDMLREGRNLDWDLLRPALTIRHDSYDGHAPKDDHGTHVAGILGADWTPGAQAAKDDHPPPEVHGVCPDIRLIDIRVFGDDGRSDEFTILSALQFLRHLNSRTDVQSVHGINLSLSLRHDVRHFACGRTPICIEVERTVNAGIVVVAAAGNGGHRTLDDHDGNSFDMYAGISITDPGNAELAITVGATHRTEPHTYGVSYFSSRGPTGDGRDKPDLIAPGEKIVSTIPGGKARKMDGTSMAAPHVSGVAALLMARHAELIGQPRRIKDILCRTATDLGRKREYQGSGLVDALRALQSV